tara:strand:+ start:1167 stop:1586 length:420 start_codon:yes stop_codon:yes gene_type:complete
LIKKISDKDFKDWSDFINSNEKVDNKDIYNKNLKSILIEKSIDLHGYSLNEANKIIYSFILSCYEKNVGKIKVITGKGSRSKNKDNPYQSENLSILKYSVPEYINSNPKLLKVIKYLNKEDVESSSKGSFDIFLKKFKE